MDEDNLQQPEVGNADENVSNNVVNNNEPMNPSESSNNESNHDDPSSNDNAFNGSDLDGDLANETQGNEDDDTPDIISGLNELNELLNDLTDQSYRNPEHSADTVRAQSSESSSVSSADEIGNPDENVSNNVENNNEPMDSSESSDYESRRDDPSFGIYDNAFDGSDLDSDGDLANEAQGNEDDDMSDGIRLISELNELNELLNDLSGHASRIAERLADTVRAQSSQSSSVSSAGESPESAHNGVEPVRSFVEHVVRRVNAGEIGISDGVLARLRRMVFRLDGRLQRRGLQLSGNNRISLSRGGSEGAAGESQQGSTSDRESPTPPNAISFDTNLPAEHSYLGSNMSRVSGVNYLETGKEYSILLFMHQHLLFPGEILPFMISDNIFDTEEADATNGLLFGVCFPFMYAKEQSTGDIYGVTCHIYEKGSDETGNILIKSRALQRFVMNRNDFTGDPQYIASHPRFKCRGVVKILPEIFLPEPLKCINMGSLNRFRDNESMRGTYKRYQAAGTPWPVFVYEQHSISAIVEKARTKLAQHKIDTMPTDPVQLSFWLVRNLHLSEELAKSIFATDSVNIRMKLIASSFKEDAIFVCRYCGNNIAECRELFAMSKHGVQTQYCNSAGYIHETNTVYRVSHDAVSFSGTPSTAFSWFPGYQWHIINCQVCTRHIGWQFKAVEPNLTPKAFYGISSSSVRISTQPELDDEADMYRGIVRVARRHI